MSPTQHGPRARYREHTKEEIKQIALAQLAEGGIGSVALTRVAKNLGMSGPAMYRYFANRDDLLSALIRDAYDDVGASTAEVPADLPPRERLHRMSAAYRAWAREEPHRYLLIAGDPLPGYQAPADTLLRARAALGPFLTVFASSQPSEHVLPLARQMTAWALRESAVSEWVLGYTGETGDPETVGRALTGGILSWARMHGPVNLEISGHFEGMGFDPEVLLHGEFEALADQFGLP
jgi:AcrR family transcriptional regulator